MFGVDLAGYPIYVEIARDEKKAAAAEATQSQAAGGGPAGPSARQEVQPAPPSGNHVLLVANVGGALTGTELLSYFK